MKVDPQKADAHFCIYWLRSPLMRKCVYRAMKGTNPNIQKINQQTVLGFPFPTSLTVRKQQEVVSYLDALQSEVDHLTYQDSEADEALGNLLPRTVTLAFSQ